MEIMCYNIGDIVHYKGVRLLVVLAVDRCRGCYFRRYASCPTVQIGACCRPWRRSDVIFRKYDKDKKENNHKRVKYERTK